MHAQTVIALLLALASTTLTNVAYLREHDAAASLPALSLRRPLHSAEALLTDRSWLVGFALESGGFALYVAALALAPLTLVQSVSAGGIGILAFVSARVSRRRLGRHELAGVLLSMLGLLARLDKGTLPIRRDEVDLDELLGGMAVRFERRARDAGRTIESNGGGGRARVDRLRIEQALGNLIDNALRHGAGTINLSAAQHGDWLELHVADEGPGFPADFAPHAFERFSRANQHRSSGGTGLGLAIVAAVAQAHGGSARATNAPGGGVSIRVPNPHYRPSRRWEIGRAHV